MVRLVACVCIVACVASAAAAVAQDGPTAALSYEAPDACPSERALRDLVVARLGRDPFGGGEDQLLDARVAVRIVRGAGSGLSGTVELSSPGGEPLGTRSLEVPSGECDALATGLVLAIVIFLDPATTPLPDDPPSAAGTASTRPPPAPARAAPPATGTEPAARRVELPRSRRRASELGLAIDARVDFGRLPAVAFGAAAGVEVRWAPLTLALEVGGATTIGAVALGANDVETVSLCASAAACLAGARHFWGCVRGGVGLLDARPIESAVPGGRIVVADAGVRVGATVEVSPPLALRLLLDVAVPLIQPSIRIDDEQVWTGSPVIFGVGVGAVVTL